MFDGDFNAGAADVYTTRVTINGTDRPAVSVDLNAEMRSGLPAQISAGGNSMTRRGTIEWATGDDVDAGRATPFRGFGVWRPQKGDEVIVYQGDGTTEWRRFTGLVDETTGAVGSGMSSTITANFDALTEDFSCEALLSTLPPLDSSGSWRNAGLSPMYFVDAALRAGGYYITPPTHSYTALNLPLQGSMLPAVGTSAELIEATGEGANTFQLNWEAPWGLAASAFEASYLPSRTRTPDEPVQISMMISESHSDGANVFIHYGGSANYYLLRAAPSRAVILQRRRDWSDLVEVCRLTPEQMQDATRAEVVIKDGTAVLRNNTGHTVEGSFTPLNDSASTRIEVTAGTDARVAGVQVSHPEAWHEFATLNHENTARTRHHTGATLTWGIINAAPRFEHQEAMTALGNLASQTLSSMWMDELGVINFAPSNGIRSRASDQTITTADDVLALSWSDRLLAVASRVTVHRLHPHFTSHTLRSVTVAQGSRKTLQHGDVIEDVYRPADDEDWYGVDESPTRLPDFGWEEYNEGVGSYVGVTYYEDGDATVGNPPGSTEITFTKTGLHRYTVRHEAVSYPEDVTAETTTYPTKENSGLWFANESDPLPVLRGWGRVQWMERETTRTTGQPGPVLHVHLGAQATEDTTTRIRDYMHELISNAFPQITGLEVIPDPRRQISDILTLRSESFLGVTIRAMVTGISETMSPTGATQQLSLDVLGVTTGGLTWAEWEQAYPGTLTYQQWRSLQDSDDTYEDFNTHPLKGADA